MHPNGQSQKLQGGIVYTAPEVLGTGETRFAAWAQGSFEDDPISSSETSCESPGGSSQSYLTTIHSGAEMDMMERSGAKEVKQGMLAGLFRIPSKRLENGAEQSKDKEAGRVNGKTQGENGSSSPRGSWLRRSLSGSHKAIPPPPPNGAVTPLEKAPSELEIAPRERSASKGTWYPSLALLQRTKSEGGRKRRPSFDAKDRTRTGGDTPPAVAAAAVVSYPSLPFPGLPSDMGGSSPDPSGSVSSRGRLESQPSAPPSAPPTRPSSGKPKGKHQRSKSGSQADAKGAGPPAWMKIMACNPAPSTEEDHERVSPTKQEEAAPPPLPLNSGLYNLGNLCFFNSLLHGLSYTPKLQSNLWQSFPEVPPPPPPQGEEPLMRFVKATPQQSPAAPAGTPSQPAEGATEAGQAGASEDSTSGQAAGAEAPLSPVEASAASKGAEGEAPRGNSQPPQGDGAKDVGREDPSQCAAPGEDHTPQEPARPPQDPITPLSADQTPGPTESRPTSAPSPPQGEQKSAAANSTPVPPKSAGDKEEGGSPVAPEQQTAEGDTIQSHPVELDSPEAAAVDGGPQEEAETSPAGPSQADSAPNGQASTAADAPPEVAERDKQVWEMTERAKAAAALSPPQPGHLSQSLAYVMAEMQRQPEGGKPVNPFPAIYYTAQRAPDLINGAQQDIHEFWMSLKDLLNEDMHSQANGKLEDIFQGKTVTTMSCKRCQNTVTQTEEFWDLSMCLTGGKSEKVSVESSLNAFCNPTGNDVKCSKCKEAEDARLAAEARKEQTGSKVLLGKIQGAFFSKREGEGMNEKVTFQKLPPALVIHLKRTQHTNVNNVCSLQKDDTPVNVNMGLKLGGLTSESAKEGLKEGGEPADYRLYACIFHLGTSPTRGHYTAACRVGPSDDDWYKFDDEKPPAKMANPLAKGVERHKATLKLENADMKDVCLLFYEQYNAGDLAEKRPSREGR